MPDLDTTLYIVHSGEAEEGVHRTRVRDQEYPTPLSRTRIVTMAVMEVVVAVADGRNAAPSNIS